MSVGLVLSGHQRFVSLKKQKKLVLQSLVKWLEFVMTYLESVSVFVVNLIINILCILKRVLVKGSFRSEGDVACKDAYFLRAPNLISITWLHCSIKLTFSHLSREWF